MTHSHNYLLSIDWFISVTKNSLFLFLIVDFPLWPVSLAKLNQLSWASAKERIDEECVIHASSARTINDQARVGYRDLVIS